MRLAAPGESSIRVDLSQIDAVFAGGYYIVCTGSDAPTYSEIQAVYGQKRLQKQEVVQQLVQLTHRILEQSREEQQHATQSRLSTHERLMYELQVLINRSDLISNPRHEHLVQEIDIARRQILMGGSYDDMAVMRSLQAIAEDQGMSLAGSSVSGRFISEISDHTGDSAHVPAEAQAEQPQAQVQVAGSMMAHTALAQDALPEMEDFYGLHYLDTFSAYDVMGIGGRKQLRHLFFAKELYNGLLELDLAPKQEPEPSELILQNN